MFGDAKGSRRVHRQKGETESRNKKAEVIALMKRAKGATLPEIMEATGSQKHTVRGFVSTLRSKGGEKIESAKNAAGEHVSDREVARLRAVPNAALGSNPRRGIESLLPRNDSAEKILSGALSVRSNWQAVSASHTVNL